MCLNEEPRRVRQKSATTPNMIEKVHSIVLDNFQVKVREVEDIMGTSNESVHRILTVDLGMNKYNVRGCRGFSHRSKNRIV